MNDVQKLKTLKVLLDDGSGYMPTDETLKAYLNLANGEILNWKYHLVGGVPDDVEEIPEQYDGIQIYAVIAGWTPAGAEGQTVSIENGVHRHFEYVDMLDYIHNHVLPYARVGAVSSD